MTIGRLLRRPVRPAPVWTRAAVGLIAALALAVPSAAEERYALIVAGATGGAPYSQQYEQWISAFSRTLVDRMQFDPDRISTLMELPDDARSATAVNVRRLLTALRRRMKADDLLVLLMIGHGTFDGVDAKFNLVGPDLESAEWAALLRGMPGRLVVINTSPASSPFIERLAAPRRVVISATDSVAQRFDTVFPEYFIAAFGEAGADIDKNGRTSVWEAFAWAAGGVRRHYQQRGQLATERPLLDDNGDGIGRDAAADGADGSLSSRTYLDPTFAGAPPTDDVLVELLQRRASLLAEVEELQIKKAFLSTGEYTREFERIMLALAKVGREIRRRSADTGRPRPASGGARRSALLAWTDAPRGCAGVRRRAGAHRAVPVLARSLPA